jgi:hypothetical protein
MAFGSLADEISNKSQLMLITVNAIYSYYSLTHPPINTPASDANDNMV